MGVLLGVAATLGLVSLLLSPPERAAESAAVPRSQAEEFERQVENVFRGVFHAGPDEIACALAFVEDNPETAAFGLSGVSADSLGALHGILDCLTLDSLAIGVAELATLSLDLTEAQVDCIVAAVLPLEAPGLQVLAIQELTEEPYPDADPSLAQALEAAVAGCAGE